MVLQFFLLNIKGINPTCHAQKHKVQMLEEEVNSSNIFTPFFALTETHLNKLIFDAEVSIKNYDMFRCDRTTRKQGGVILYIHNSITVNDVRNFTDDYTEAVMVHLKKSKLIIVVIYRAPNTPINSFRNCLQSVSEFIKDHKGNELIVMGDFNFRFLDWQTETIDKTKFSIPRDEQDQASAFIRFTHQHLLTQMVEENTRADKSILDLILTTDPEAIHNISVEKISKSITDHDVVRCSFLNNTLQQDHITEPKVLQPKQPLDNLNLDRADWTAINEELKTIDWDSELHNNSVNGMYEILEKHINTICSKHAPERTRTPYAFKIPNHRLALIRRKKRLSAKINHRKYVLKDFPKSLIEKLEEKKVMVEAKIGESYKEEKELNEIKAIAKMKTQPKLFFKYMKKFRKTESKIGPLADADGKIHSDAKTKAELLQKQYTSVFSDPDKASTEHIPQNQNRNYPTLEDITFTPEDVIKAIESIPNSAAPGPDKLPTIVLKECKEQLALPIYTIWRKSLDTGEIPEILKTQGIVPIFKKGNKSNPANYRPVSLTSHLIKLFEKIIRIKIVDYIEEHNLLRSQQHAFRKYRSCLTQLLIHIDKILEIVGRGSNVDVVYLDFSKAFDKVDHKLLLFKIHQKGIQGKIYTWIANFLRNRTQSVIVDGVTSESAEVKSGVPQGTVLGPILFLLFINDIADAMEYTSMQMFADDCKLVKEIQSNEDHEKLQKDLHSAIIWALLNNMEINKDKFVLLQYGCDEDLKNHYKLDEESTLENSPDTKDLGVIVSEDLSWQKQITSATNDGKKFSAWILRCFNTRKHVLLQLFKTFVLSKLEYAAPLWLPYLKKDIEKLESVQRTFTSKLEELEDLNYHQRLKSLKLYSLQRRRERFSIITMWKIANDQCPNQLDLEFYNTHRFGIKCRRKLYNSTTRVHIKTLRQNSFASIGPALFNCIPKSVKNKETLISFKSALDKWLKLLPDEPPISGYVTQNGNSVLEWVGSGHYSLVNFDEGGDTVAREGPIYGDATVTVAASCM